MEFMEFKGEFSGVQGAKRGLKLYPKKTKSLRPGINDDEEGMLGNMKIVQADSVNYLGSNISKGGGCIDHVKSREAKAEVVFLWLKSFGGMSK